MTCTKGAIEDYFFVKWIKPEVADAESIIDDVRALRAQTGKPVHYIAIIGTQVDPPGDDVRSSMKKNIDELLEYCASVHLVIEGRGFRRAMARSIGTGIFLLSKNRGRTFAHDSVEQALARSGLAPDDAARVIEQARQRGVLNPASA